MQAMEQAEETMARHAAEFMNMFKEDVQRNDPNYSIFDGADPGQCLKSDLRKIPPEALSKLKSSGVFDIAKREIEEQNRNDGEEK